MAWTTPVDQSTGTLITATIFNTQIIDNLTYLHGDAGAVTINNTITAPSFTTVQGANGTIIQNLLISTDTQPSIRLISPASIQFGPGGSTATDLQISRQAGGGNTVLQMLVGQGWGYGTGTGGTGTCVAGSSVTINKPCGKVTASAAVTSGSNVAYTVTNSCVAATDLVLLNITTTATTSQTFQVTVSAGSFLINYSNNSGSSQTPAFMFAIIKGATS